MIHDPVNPLPESDAVPESPYLRQQRQSPICRGRKARVGLRACRRGGRWLVGLLLALGGLLALTHGLTHSPRLVLSFPSRIPVYGNRYVSRQEVLAALGVSPGQNLLRLSLDEKKQQLERIPWVKSARVARLLPDGLAVHLGERKPLAFVHVGGRMQLLDAEGVLLENPGRAQFDFPVLTGWEESLSEPERLRRLEHYRQLVTELREVPAEGWLVSEVNVSDPEDLKVVLSKDSEDILAHFGGKDFARHFRKFLSVISEARQQVPIRSVDLRFKNQMVINPES